MSEKNKHSCTDVAKWHDLEAEMNNWETDHGNHEIYVSQKLLFLKLDGG
jgi:hypothetical protein